MESKSTKKELVNPLIAVSALKEYKNGLGEIIMVTAYIDSDTDFLCAVCQKPTKQYFIVPRGISDDIYTIVLHKLCLKCFDDTGDGTA